MRRLLAAFALAVIASTVACSDEPDSETENTCRVQHPGVTALAASCAAPAGEVEPIEAFRLHTVRASSAAGGATRLADGIVNAAVHCMAEAVAVVIGDAIASVLTRQNVDTAVTCEDIYAAGGGYKFANGVYTLFAQQRGGAAGSPAGDDTAASTDLRLYLTRDAGAFKKGDLVTVDVHQIDAFLLNARIVVDAEGSAAIAYDAPGPLAPLLGQGATPPNPLKLRKDTTTLLASAFEVEGAMHADLADCGTSYRTVTDLTIPRTPIDQDVKPVLVSSVLTAPGVRIEAQSWNATYSPSTPGLPRGHIDAVVTGIPGAAKAGIDFDDATGENATLTIACTP